MSEPFTQLIFCVESNQKAKTDKYYMDAVLGQFYQVGNNKISYVYMDGKHRYHDDKIIKKINKLAKDYGLTGGASKVIYVFDKDKNMVRPDDHAFVNELQQYCRQKRYHLIWFVRTVEDVFWKKCVKQVDKVHKAQQFKRKGLIHQMDPKPLKAGNNVNARHKSNVLNVLDGFKEIKR